MKCPLPHTINKSSNIFVPMPVLPVPYCYKKHVTLFRISVYFSLSSKFSDVSRDRLLCLRWKHRFPYYICCIRSNGSNVWGNLLFLLIRWLSGWAVDWLNGSMISWAVDQWIAKLLNGSTIRNWRGRGSVLQLERCNRWAACPRLSSASRARL